MSGRVIVAGAGCGDYVLITMRGYEALKSCDVVIYDSLIDSRLLDFCKDGAEKICVGKRAGRHSSTQEEINTLLVEKAAEGGVVLRLKGGDPFVFGRGGRGDNCTQSRRHTIQPYTGGDFLGGSA